MVSSEATDVREVLPLVEMDTSSISSPSMVTLTLYFVLSVGFARSSSQSSSAISMSMLWTQLVSKSFETYSASAFSDVEADVSFPAVSDEDSDESGEAMLDSFTVLSGAAVVAVGTEEPHADIIIAALSARAVMP